MNNDFCVDVLNLDPVLRADHGVLRIAAFAVTAEASDAAERILESARSEAEALLKSARAEGRELAHAAEQAAIERADHLLKSLEHAHSTFLTEAEGMVLDMVQTIFDRLVNDMTPRERIEAALRCVMQEAPPRLIDPVLRVHPDDIELLPTMEWKVHADGAMARGGCRLEASSGEWRADFDASVQALRRALDKAGDDTGDPIRTP